MSDGITQAHRDSEYVRKLDKSEEMPPDDKPKDGDNDAQGVSPAPNKVGIEKPHSSKNGQELDG